MYDYVIVGAGSAGCVLAARLSEDPDTSVLLLEAGPPDVNENIHVPLGYLKLARTEVDWDYDSAPEPNCGGRRLPLPRGKVLGGSSSTNAMVYIRGNHADYDEWGVDGLGLGGPLPLLPQAPRTTSAAPPSGMASAARCRSPTSAPATRSRPPSSRPGSKRDYARNEDFNGAEQDGVGMYQVTQRGGMRASASVAYLHPAMERPNLTVMPYMHVNRVLFEGTRAVGVEATQLGQAQELRAEREVILCGGAYNSPQLLMLSGVGPAEHLAMREVEVLLDQPAVGENLSDHAATYGVWTTPEPESLLAALEPAALEEFAASQTGPLRLQPRRGRPASPGSEAGAEAPDTQFHVAPDPDRRRGHGRPRGARRLGLPLPADAARPRHGPARLQRPDREADRPQRASTPRRTTWRGRSRRLRLAQEICAQPAMRRYCAEPFTVPAGESDEDLRAHVAATTFPIYHPVGHLRDRLGGRRRAAGRGAGGAARRRRLGDAGRAPRQHQRPDDRDRRAGGGPDRRRRRCAPPSRPPSAEPPG